ncbi:MAG: hypothetical protein WCK49_11185 [Myxococcaceae bacterium]
MGKVSQLTLWIGITGLASLAYGLIRVLSVGTPLSGAFESSDKLGSDLVVHGLIFVATALFSHFYPESKTIEI